jgi:transcriptional regulator with GAF, ATPase, and Fis domain
MEEVVRLRDELERERDYLREEVKGVWRHGQMVGESSALQRVMERIEAVAPTSATVLIQGESGVGKELVARAIHEQSARSAQTMVRVNCATIPRELFESEFFGHVRGAFTGAHRDRAGRFELAKGGTIFLDEVGEIPPELQVKLLRVIQEREYERIGEGRTRKTDVRILVATNRDLDALVKVGQFREDLYYRLTVFPIEVPPLRERRTDILPLARHFLSVAAQEFERPDLVLTKYQGDTLTAYDWPGNVRELRNVIERAVLLSRGSRLRLDLALPESQAKPSVLDAPAAGADPQRPYLTAVELKQMERQNLIAALEQAHWKVAGESGAAALLGLKPSTLESKIKSFRIKKPAR